MHILHVGKTYAVLYCYLWFSGRHNVFGLVAWYVFGFKYVYFPVTLKKLPYDLRVPSKETALVVEHTVYPIFVISPR